jgi:glycine/D-amino acid oxidase-like deaminating enzyme
VDAPGWDDDPVVADWIARPRLNRDRRVDACVVGLGASGLAAIEVLLGRGLTVVGLDAGRIASGASGRNGGFLLGGGAPFLSDAIARWGAEAAVALYRETLAELDRLEAHLGPSVIRRTGSIRLAGLPGEPLDATEAADRDRELADCARQAAALRAYGLAVEGYDGRLGQGIYLPDDASTNPAVRAVMTARALVGRIELYEDSPATRIESGTVVTALGRVHAPVVIIAVDGRLELLLPELVGQVRTARLQMVRTAPVERPLPEPTYSRWGYDYAQADETGRLYVGGGRDRFEAAEWSAATSPTGAVQDYIDQVASRFAGAPVQVERRWAASVGYTRDGRALVRTVADGVVACGGYSGTGNLVGPIAARAAVALALDGMEPPSYFNSGR